MRSRNDGPAVVIGIIIFLFALLSLSISQKLGADFIVTFKA